jgi:hypothetical protein
VLSLLAAFALPLAVAVWGYTRIHEQRAFLEYRKGKHRESIEALNRNAKQDRDAMLERLSRAEAALNETAHRVTKLENGITPMRRGA